MLAKAGAKLLDFGLAKLRAPVTPLAGSSTMSVPTQEPATSAGTLLGTIPYMAPEQNALTEVRD
jgi:serine/threonine protein kinase